MYLYYFNHKNGTSNRVSCAEITSVRKISSVHDGKPLYMVVGYDPEKTDIPGRPYKKVDLTEGAIWRRTFWLEDENVIKADEIVNDYLKARYLEAKEKYNRIEKALGH